jgi:hypothetical protein
MISISSGIGAVNTAVIVEPFDPLAEAEAASSHGCFYDLLISSAVELENTLVSSYVMQDVFVESMTTAAATSPSGAEHQRRGHRGHGHHHGGEATTGWDVRADSKG